MPQEHRSRERAKSSQPSPQTWQCPSWPPSLIQMKIFAYARCQQSTTNEFVTRMKNFAYARVQTSSHASVLWLVYIGPRHSALVPCAPCTPCWPGWPVASRSAGEPAGGGRPARHRGLCLDTKGHEESRCEPQAGEEHTRDREDITLPLHRDVPPLRIS